MIGYFGDHLTNKRNIGRTQTKEWLKGYQCFYYLIKTSRYAQLPGPTIVINPHPLPLHLISNIYDRLYTMKDENL
jgi:hypothetical protein